MTKMTLAALLAATTLGTAVAAQEIVFGHNALPGNPRTVAGDRWAEMVTECTGGAMTVNHAHSAQMGDDVELLTSAAAGIIQVTANSQGATSQIIPEVGLLGLPFLFEDMPTAWTVLDGEVGDLIDERAQAAGLKLLGFWDNGIRQISHSTKNVPTPADLSGMKIRTPPDQMTVDIFEALGAAPAPLAFSELPSALQSGVFDGQENPLVNIYSSKIHEITPFITMTGHKYEATPVLASMAWWSGLDEATQGCVQDATDEAGAMQRDLMLSADEELRVTLAEEGVTFLEADKDAYREATRGVYDAYAQEYPELVAALREAAGL